MKSGWAIAGVLLAGCSHGADEPKASASGTACNIGNDLVRPYVGRPYSDAVGEDFRHKSRSAVLRVVRPGDVMTADFRADRVTIRLNEQGRIASADCG